MVGIRFGNIFPEYLDLVSSRESFSCLGMKKSCMWLAERWVCLPITRLQGKTLRSWTSLYLVEQTRI